VNAATGKCTNVWKAAPETRRHVPQWQLTTRMGAALARHRIAPHKHPPVHSMLISRVRAPLPLQCCGCS
jgi:hypothetical protein